MNLIEEIEVKKINIENYHNEKYADGFIDGINEALEVINEYNIITAPKQIKLSEIVDRLRNDFKDYLFEYDNGFINKIPIIAIWNKSKKYCYATIRIENNKLILTYQDDFDYPKWLYTLWIACTEIIDDLGE